MKRILLTLTLLLAFGASGAAAQDLTEVAGLESSYGRIYSDGSSNSSVAVAVSAEEGSTPSSEGMEGEAEYKGVEIIGVTFDSEDSAKAFLEEMRTGIDESAASADESANAEVKDLEIDNDGFFAVMHVENTGDNAVALFVDGNTLFLVDVTHPDRDEATKITNDVVAYIVDAEAGDDEVTLNTDGTSTGGVFDRMPASGDDAVGGLEIVEDYDVLAE